MKLYLVRHGDSSSAVNDNLRPLSERGIADIQHLANFIAPLQLHVSQILHSEKLRAKQTAEILAAHVQSENPMGTRQELDPLASNDIILDEIYARDTDLMLVGHMPFMGMLVNKLTTGNEDNNVVSFTTGSMVCLEHITRTFWVIRWVLNPELFTA